PWDEAQCVVTSFERLKWTRPEDVRRREVRSSPMEPPEPRGRDIVVVLDAAKATGDAYFDSFSRLLEQRVFGLLLPGPMLTAADELDLRFRFGPRIECAGPVAPAVAVHFALPPLCNALPSSDMLARKRALWQDDSRNQYIALVAKAFAAGDLRGLWALDLLLHETEVPAFRPRRTMILVESPEHGRRILQHLPGWSMRWANPTDPTATVISWALDLNRCVVTMTAS